MLIAPTEPKPFLTLGESSSIPERYGVDFLFGSKQGLIGIQRKQLSDFIASIRDGRLQREVVLMTDGRLDQPILILEGEPTWTNTGQLLHSHTTWTRAQHLGLLCSLLSKGIWVLGTSTLADTIEYLSLLISYMDKTEHRSLDTRPKTKRDPVFGTRSENGLTGQRIHLLQGIDGISVTRAKNILEHFNDLPLRWTVTVDEMSQVKGIGKGTAEKIIKAFGTIADNNQEELNIVELPS